MITQFTKISAKDLQKLSGHENYHAAYRQLRCVADALGVKIVLVTHLANYWNVPSAEIICQLSSR